MKLFLLSFLLLFVHGDVYIQAFRGSNNRLDEANRERNNGNRMFDSQNNDRGGYNVGKLNLYENEEFEFNFNVQHGCNSDGTLGCETIVQIMCDDKIRDGTTTTTIPTNNLNCLNFDCDSDPKYGRHESFHYYEQCKRRERNQGLFTASQNLKGSDATKTRQNPGGTRRGLECPEERDYYPYWSPSPWVDVAVMTRDTERCARYQAESQNVKGVWYCDIPYRLFQQWNGQIPLDQENCEEIKMLKADIEELEAEQDEDLRNGRRFLRRNLNSSSGNSTAEAVDLYIRAEWKQSEPHNVDPPECIAAEASRRNHLGLIGQKKSWTYKLKIPELLRADEKDRKCVMRLRYNITEDYQAWESAESTDAGVDALQDSPRSMNQRNAGNDPANLAIWEEYGIDRSEIETSFDRNKGDSREYVFINNPQVDVIGETFQNDFRLKFQLAINTAQYGRTFQDRSHVFYIKKRPDELVGKKITMMTVQGKRGNIVQTFPGTEYFFVPDTANVKVGEYLHFEWTGSDTNPNNNDGQGKQGTDRTNMAILRGSNYEGGDTSENGMQYTGSLRNNYPAYNAIPATGMPNPNLFQCGNQPPQVLDPVGGMSTETMAQLFTTRRSHEETQDYGNMEELDDAATSFAMAPVQMTEIGCWAVMGTRNNNFSNRSQKGAICVNEGDFSTDTVTQTGKNIITDTGGVIFNKGVAATAVNLEIKTWNDIDNAWIVSKLMEIKPHTMANSLTPGQKFKVTLPYEQHSMMRPTLKWKQEEDDEWTEIDAGFLFDDDGKYSAEYMALTGGYFEVEESVDPWAVVAIIISSFALIAAVAYIMKIKMSGGLEERLNKEDELF